jgi:NitT/TauT family transport system ATP-binding protein
MSSATLEPTAPPIASPLPKERPHVVVFDNVRKTYNEGLPSENTAISGVSFTVADIPDKGEFICILGPSGCGKSTILRLIAGLQPQHPQTEGSVLVFGKPVKGPAADRGMVFQDYTALDQRSVLGNIAYGLEVQGYSRNDRLELARYWIEQVGLDVAKDSHKYPHELSGGMKQRVAIARTLILRPRIILMDEPCGALDPPTQMGVANLLLKLWKEVEATVFYVTHNVREAVFLGDRIYIMGKNPGHIVEERPLKPSYLPALEMSRVPEFRDTVDEISELIDKLDKGKQ